jgi:hypothetical protein
MLRALLLTTAAALCIAPAAQAQYSTYSGPGYNYSTQRIGGTTFINGRTRNGGSFTGSTQSIGGTTFYNGRSNGRSFSGSCSTIGSHTFCN